ncbi:MAG: DUF4416 family protein [Planctomycetes bacterium]|nr:DUF4416 family protein [Planctomycetota bacterium]
MAKPQLPENVKLFAAILWASRDALRAAEREMAALWGDIDFAGEDHPFDATDYYEREMGADLRRRLVSFARLIAPEALVDAKLEAARIEDRHRGPAGRLVNIDAGTVDLGKVVLASAKAAGQKIHLAGGIYADLVLRYKKGRFHPFEWTFPDFASGRYEPELLEIRRIYKGQVRGGSAA